MRLSRALGVAVVLFTVPAFAANDPAAAREQLKIGYGLAQDDKCEEAIPHLAESLRLDPKAITLINLADCEERVHRLTAAMGHWVDARARAQVESMKAIEEEATDRAKALEPRLARLTLALAPGTPADATVERDGVVLGAPSLGIPLPLDPGAHVLVVKASGRADRRTEITLAEGESRTLAVEASPAGAAPVVVASAPAEARTGTSPLVWAGFGIAAAGVVLGAISGGLALGAGSDAETACPNLRCSQGAFDDVEGGRRWATVSTVSFVVAGVGAAIGLYGVFAGRRAPRTVGWRF